MLGGSGRGVMVNRALTEIEQNVTDGVVKLILENLTETWRGVVDVQFRISGRETRPQMLQVAAPNEIVVAVVFEVKVGDVRGLINLCLPTNVAEIAGTHFSATWQRQRRELTDRERAWLHENFGRVPMPVVPQIRTGLNAGSVLELGLGEIIALPLPADQPLDVYVGGIRKFTGRLATERGRLMVLVENRCLATPVAQGA
jgi:flagellar motor switch protein FliM